MVSRRRSPSRSRSRDDRRKGKKKKDKKRDDRDRGRKRSSRSRSRSRSRSGDGGSEKATGPVTQAGPPDEAVLGRSIHKQSDFNAGKQEDKKAAWREELERGKAAEEAEESDVNSGEAPEDNEDDVAKALADSRKRREALIAKWVNKGEGPDGNGGSFDMPNTAEDAESDTDKESDAEDKPAARAAKKDGTVEEVKQKKDLMRFILDSKAEHDQDCMFNENADEEQLKAKRDMQQAIGQTGASADDWDDHEGYYRAKIGELMEDRYLVVEDNCGQGVFSGVVKCKDQQSGDLMVAIKIMRHNDMMQKAAEKEIEVLERCNKADKQNKRHVIRLLRSFMYRGHLCLVFECMWDNLRVALKKYTKNQGMSLQAVRAYSKQLLTAMKHIHKCEVIHADIKPDNILISAGHNVVKICDLGSAMYLEEVEVTPYLVSRFYRAPEIVLGCKYGYACDIFAIGCTLCELFTGKVLFPGKSNNDMVRLFMEVKGKFPHKMIKSGICWKQNFDENFDFKHLDMNKATRKKVVRTITDMSAKRPIMDMIMARVGVEKQKSEKPEDILYVKKAKQFADLMNQLTTLDPERRMTAADALNHPFVSEPGLGSKDAGKGQPAKGPGHKR